MPLADPFWLPPIEEAAPSRQSNRARRGDSDYGVKGWNEQEEKAKKEAVKAAKKTATARRQARGRGEAVAQGGEFNDKHPRGQVGTSKGGKFVKKGDTGSVVGEVQDQLGAKHTGVYDANTAASVIAFQKRHGLVPDGVVGRQTALALSGQYDRARKAGPGSLGPETGALVGLKSEGKSRSRSKRRKAKGERARGGFLVADDDEDRPAQLQETIDRLGNLHDGLGRFALKLGKKGKGSAAAAIPEYDPEPLKFGKSAGGSNGARIATHRDGSKWLVKAYRGDEDRVATELLANAVYRDVGARVPRAGRIKLNNGRQAISYPLLEGAPRKYVFQKKDAQPSLDVGQHYMTDALLANWDVAGLEDDNILWDGAGRPFRVDQGGTLEFRAQGGRKDFGPVPTEVTSMMLPGGQGRRSSAVTVTQMQRQAAQIAGTLTPERVGALVKAAQFKDARMAARVERNLNARVAWMRRFGLGEVPLPEPPAPTKPLLESWWLPRLEEASALSYVWNEALHPRDSHGKFANKAKGLKAGGAGLALDSKTTLKKDKDGRFRVVRSGGITKGYDTPEDAVRQALDASAKGGEGDSVGGAVKYKSYNDYLKAKGVNSKDPDAFGGQSGLTAGDLFDEVVRLDKAIKDAQTSEDKYENRKVKTLTARRAEADEKFKALNKMDGAAGGVATGKLKGAADVTPAASSGSGSSSAGGVGGTPTPGAETKAEKPQSASKPVVPSGPSMSIAEIKGALVKPAWVGDDALR